jgi:serine acetyltransferase
VTHSTLVGNRARLQADVIDGPWTVIEEEVSVGPRVTFIGDPTMGRRPAGPPERGTRVCAGARIGTASIIFPPVTIGSEAVIGAASLVREDVPARTVVVGTPAVPVRSVRDDELLAAWKPRAAQ